MPMQVNLTAKVNKDAIRRIQHNGRETIVVKSYTLPGGVVMNGGMYEQSEIDAHFDKLNGTVAPIGHPKVNGQFVPAKSADGLLNGYAGISNQNAQKEGNRISIEKYIDVEVASKYADGKRLIERIEAIEKGGDVEPIHTSVAVFLDREPVANQNLGYTWKARIHSMDHDAILLDTVGAATPNEGVGMFVNCDLAEKPVVTNAGVLVGIDNVQRERMLRDAVDTRWPQSGDNYSWIDRFTEGQVVIRHNGSVDDEVYSYSITNGVATLGEGGTAVVKVESWVEKLPPQVNKLLESLGIIKPKTQAEPPVISKDVPMTADEIKAVTDGFTANVSALIAPLAQRMETLEANQKAFGESITANARAAEKEKRDAVALKYGEPVANQLSGDALDVMYKSLGIAAPVGNALDAKGKKEDFAQVPE